MILSKDYLMDTYNSSGMSKDEYFEYVVNKNNQIVEEAKKYNLNPVYIVTVYTGTLMGKAITHIKKCKFSHAAISLDSTLEKLYSFNGASNTGLSFESLSGYIRYNVDSIVRVSAIFLNDEMFKNLNSVLDYYISNKDNTHYSFTKLAYAMLNKEYDIGDLNLVCSEFVNTVLTKIGISLFDKPNNLITPQDLAAISNPRVYVLYDGLCINYSSDNIQKLLRSLKPQPIRESAGELSMLDKSRILIEAFKSKYMYPTVIMETKEFPIQFEEDGSLIIKNYKKLNYEQEYQKSHRLLKMYEKNSNIESMKYEISKLWFINTVLEKKIYAAEQDELEELNKLRGKVLLDFSKYLNFILKEDKEFNFTVYYENSPFSDVKIRISGATLDQIIKLIKKAL